MGYRGSWCGNQREGDHWGDLGVDGWIIVVNQDLLWNICLKRCSSYKILALCTSGGTENSK